MRKREGIEHSNPVYAEVDVVTDAVDSNAQKKGKDAQVLSGSKSVASTQGIMRGPGRPDMLLRCVSLM